MPGLSIVGRSLPRLDGLEKVTGQARYGADMKLAGMLYGKVLRSQHAHARIVSIDTIRARRLAGVKAILTAADIANGRFGYALKDQPVLAQGKVRYQGDAVALVAAVDEDVAQEALGLMQVEYEELPGVFSVEEAIKPSAPLVHEELGRYEYNPFFGHPRAGTNISTHFKLRKGDLEAGFVQADFVFEDSFEIQMVHHCYTEPHAALAVADASNRVTIWTNTQSPYAVQRELADALKLPSRNIRVIATRVGGGFGGKISANVEPYCAVLAQRTKRPVKMVLTRSEEFISTSVRHPASIKMKTGVKKDGTLTAGLIEILWDTGAYNMYGQAVSYSAGYAAAGPYHFPNLAIDSYCLYTNRTPAGAFRGFGVCQTAWAVESHLDTMAAHLGLDPLEFRLKNAFDKGSISSTGEVLESVGVKECLKKAAGLLPWKKEFRGRGRGIACIHKFTAPFAPSCAFVKVNPDGSVGVLTSAVDIGQGSDTVLAQMVAEELGVGVEDIVLACPDTSSTPFDVGTLSSRITFHMGNAVRLAAADARRQLLQVAAQMLEANPDDLEMKEKKIFVRGAPEKAVSFAEVAAASHYRSGAPVLGRGSFLKTDLTVLDPETGQGAKPTEYWKYAAQAAEVEVDTETGEVNIAKIAAAADVGFAIHPQNVEGQIQGAAAMGLGSALFEELIFEGGKTVNPSFMDYHLPGALDVPPLLPGIVEIAHRDGPYGAKGLGEGGTPPTAPAISNAIFNATGVRIKELPITSEKVLKGLKKLRHQA